MNTLTGDVTSYFQDFFFIPDVEQGNDNEHFLYISGAPRFGSAGQMNGAGAGLQAGSSLAPHAGIGPWDPCSVLYAGSGPCTPNLARRLFGSPAGQMMGVRGWI